MKITLVKIAPSSVNPPPRDNITAAPMRGRSAPRDGAGSTAKHPSAKRTVEKANVWHPMYAGKTREYSSWILIKWFFSCPLGWFGQKCNECSPKDGCVNGYCAGDAFTCKCKPNWAGDNCDKVVDRCLDRPCLNGGRCFATGLYEEYKCNCPPGYSGRNCETTVSLFFIFNLVTKRKLKH